MDKKEENKIRQASSFSCEEREFIVKDYLTSDLSKTQVWHKHTGQNEEHGNILKWMRKLGYLEDKNPNSKAKKILLLSRQFLQSVNPDNSLSVKELEDKIKQLQKELETSRLKEEGYQLMIEIAEKELKIPIRKKLDTK